LKERQKQKEEARLAREAIKAKLEQDKLERQSRQRDSGQSIQLGEAF
jgi:AMMECR1 domain-containing protein